MDSAVRWGILGAGKIAGKFAQDLNTVPGTVLAGIGSRSREKAAAFAREFGALKAYDSYESLAAAPDIDIIYVASPHSLHKEHSLLCMHNGKAVLCEKPLGLHLAEVKEMIAEARKSRVLFMEALWTRFMPHFNYALEVLASQELGKLKHLEADFGFEADYDPATRLFDPSLGGGSLLDIGIYPVFAALCTLGVPNTIKASADFAPTRVDYACTIHFEYNSGATARLYSSFREKTPTTAVFHCEKGSLVIHSRFHEAVSITVSPEKGEERTLNFPRSTRGYDYEVAHMNQLFREGRTESLLMTHDLSLRLMELLDRIRAIAGIHYKA